VGPFGFADKADRRPKTDIGGCYNIKNHQNDRYFGFGTAKVGMGGASSQVSLRSGLCSTKPSARKLVSFRQHPDTPIAKHHEDLLKVGRYAQLRIDVAICL
jgi:hypothetical protein